MAVTPQHGSFIPRPRKKRRKFDGRGVLRAALPFIAIIGIGSVGFLSLPSILAIEFATVQKLQQDPALTLQSFPVTVNPATRTIVENPQVEELLIKRPTGLSASAGSLTGVFNYVAIRISELSAYRQVASVGGFKSLFVTIYPGYRKEQVANTFATTLDWTPKERAEFLAALSRDEPSLTEGSVVPGIYFLSVSSPADVAATVHTRFETDILARYGTTTQAQVPIKDALTIASLLERESGSWEDMRLISGVIWNRLFIGMKLQIDATLQYAEANGTKGVGGWWPSVEPKDKYITSKFNTYQNAGLPPAPIANPSVAAVLAALNPKKTDCLFYFHDTRGKFYCSKDYAGHVALLKKVYGQGK